ncbi:MAG: dienelactone hydrolase family protein [Marinosulfonomonas sp.]
MAENTAQNTRSSIWKLLNGGTERIRFDSPEHLRDVTQDGITVHYLRFSGSHGETVPGYFLPPRDTQAPAVLYCHAHGARYDIGIQEFIEGRPALTGPYLADFAARGWAVLCLEMPTFGARQTPNESALSKAHLWRGTTLFGQMISELVAGIDFLESHPGVDAQRIGTAGISMGGTHAWWLSALDERVRAAASMGCFADLSCLIDTHAHDDHGHYMTVPGLLKLVSTAQLAGLAVPRAQLHCIGEEDVFTSPRCFAKARDELTKIYAGAEHPPQFFSEPGIGHQETPEMRRRVLGFLEENLSRRGAS